MRNIRVHHTRERFALYVRNFVFGVEDSLVSTVGLLSGVAAVGLPRETILLMGAILIFVEAFSMAVGSFLSERSAEEYIEQKNVSSRRPFIGGIIMFFSYFVAGFIPLFPYLITPPNNALWVSIILSLLTLFALGALGAKIFHTKIIRGGVRMFAIGGVAVIVGVVVGTLIT